MSPDSAPEIQILLIGGPPGAGKTTLGRAVAAELGWASLTIDDIFVAAQFLTNEETHPAFHQMRGTGYVRYFTESSKEKLVTDSLELEEAMWPVVERVISSRIMKESPAVIDWWLLRPSAVAALDSDQVTAVWLHIDPDTLWERERHISGWMEGSADRERMLDNFMHRSLWRNELAAAEASQVGQTVLRLTGQEPAHELAARIVETIGR